MMRKLICMCIAMAMTVAVYAVEKIAGETVSFFQTPTKGIVFDYADVYVTQDADYAKKINTYQNDDWKRIDMVLNKLVDKEGRFSVWKFVPSYIKHSGEKPSRLVVEILLYNEPIKIDSSMQPINKEGEYAIPYSVKCRYRLSDSQGALLSETDYGTIHGTYITKNVDFSNEFPVDSRVGIQAAFMRVRQEIYAQYGFGSFEMPFELYDFSSVVGLDVLQKSLVEQINQKDGLILNAKAKSVMSAYCDVLDYHSQRLTAQEQAFANRNLALCKAWLGDTIAVRYLNKYATTLTTLQDSIDYFSIDLFVRYYPKGIRQHEKLLRLLSGNISWMVDAYTYNDLLCNVYEIEYPIPFLPLQPLKGKVAKVTGELHQEGKQPLYFTLKYNKDGMPKSLDMNRLEYDDKKKNNVRINTLHISYKKGEYDKITCSSSQFIRMLMPGLENMNQPVDKMEQLMHCKTDNVLGGFVKFKVETEETNHVMFDTEGQVYITGEKSLSRPHGLLKQIADDSGEKFPAMVSANSSAYEIALDMDENGFVHQYDWKGYVLMEKNVGYDNYAYLKADSVHLKMNMMEPYTSGSDGSILHHVSLKIENELEGTKLPNTQNVDADKNKLTYQLSNTWPFQVHFDDNGNWINLKVGPYTVNRTITYQ